MKDIKRVVGFNLLALIVLTIIINLISTDSERELEIMIFMMFAVALQVAVNFGLALFYFIRGDAPFGKSFLVSMAVVLVIGFSACLGSIAI